MMRWGGGEGKARWSRSERCCSAPRSRPGLPCLCFLSCVAALMMCGPVEAVDLNGNEFALRLKEAKDPITRHAVLGESLGKQHFFRYLRIVALREGETNGYPFVEVNTVEPSSKMSIQFTVVKSMSLAVMKEPPASGVGDALAVTGRVRSVDPERRVIVLSPLIVRYKDRLSPKDGKEMVSERESSGIVYSFTGGKEAVNVSRRDADLLQHEARIVAERGKDGWAQFLIDAIARRDQQEKERRDKLGIYRKETPAPAPEGAGLPEPSVITGDEE